MLVKRHFDQCCSVVVGHVPTAPRGSSPSWTIIFETELMLWCASRHNSSLLRLCRRVCLNHQVSILRTSSQAISSQLKSSQLWGMSPHQRSSSVLSSNHWSSCRMSSIVATYLFKPFVLRGSQVVSCLLYLCLVSGLLSCLLFTRIVLTVYVFSFLRKCVWEAPVTKRSSRKGAVVLICTYKWRRKCVWEDAVTKKNASSQATLITYGQCMDESGSPTDERMLT